MINWRQVATLAAVWLAMIAALTVAAGCEPESGPPAAKTDDGKQLRGVIINGPKSKAPINIYRNWKGGNDPGDAKPTKLGIGRQGNVAVDWDGGCVPKNRAGKVRLQFAFVDFTQELRKGQCVKINDGQTATFTVY